MGYRVEADLRNEKIGFKIREHTIQKVPYQIIIGDKEEEDKLLSIRTREGNDMGRISLEDFISILEKSIELKGMKSNNISNK